MVKPAHAAALVLGALLGGCPLTLPPNCANDAACPSNMVCGGDKYCHYPGWTNPSGGGTTARATSGSSSSGTRQLPEQQQRRFKHQHLCDHQHRKQ